MLCIIRLEASLCHPPRGIIVPLVELFHLTGSCKPKKSLHIFKRWERGFGRDFCRLFSNLSQFLSLQQFSLRYYLFSCAILPFHGQAVQSREFVADTLIWEQKAHPVHGIVVNWMRIVILSDGETCALLCTDFHCVSLEINPDLHTGYLEICMLRKPHFTTGIAYER